MCPTSGRCDPEADGSAFSTLPAQRKLSCEEISNLDSSATWLLCFFANPFTRKEQLSNGLNLINN